MSEPDGALAQTLAAAKRLDDSLGLSLNDMSLIGPVRAALIDHPTRQQHKDIQTFLKTFEQLQDLAANRLIRAILVELAVDTSGWSARDAFEKMESLGALQSAREFRLIAQLRNRLVHEYPMSAAKRAQRIGDAVAAAEGLRLELWTLFAFAEELLDSDREEPAAEDDLDRLAREIPDALWVWGPVDEEPVVWKAWVRGENAPVLDERRFRRLFESCLELRVRAWLAWERDNPDIPAISQITGRAPCDGPSAAQRPDALAEIAVRSTLTGFLIGGWHNYEDFNAPIVWPVTMRPGTQEEVELFRGQLQDDPDLESLLEFWIRGSSET